MVNGLNFNRSLFILFLSFVSFLVSPRGYAQTRPQETPDRKIELLTKEVNANPNNLTKVVELAHAYFKKKDYEKTTSLLWKNVDKIDRPALILLTKAHHLRKEPEEMIRAINIVISKNDKDFEAHTLMGNAYVLQKKHKEAMESYQLAVNLNPKYEPAYNGLIDLYEKRNPPNLYELRILYQDMIENIGPRYQYLLKLCEINTLDGTFEPAIRRCKEAIVKNPKASDAYVYLGLCYRATDQEAKGLQFLKKAAKNFPKSELAQYNYAKILEEQKNFIEAMKHYKVGTEASPASARSWLGLATTSFEIKKYELSLIAYKNACKYDRKNAAAFRRAATILRNTKNSEWLGQFESASESCTF